jgi:hypothetical protein
MSKIDLHIIKHPTQERTISTPEHPLINVHYVDGYDRHIGKGRADGFSLGNEEYVSFMDDDDRVITDHLSKIIELLDSERTISGVATAEYVKTVGKPKKLKPYGKQTGDLFHLGEAKFIHHLVVLRRSAIEGYINSFKKFADISELCVFSQMIMDGHKFAYFDKVCYEWNRSNANNAERLHIPKTQEQYDILKKIAESNI